VDDDADAAELRRVLADFETAIDGEPRGLNFSELARDAQLQRLAADLWKDVQNRSEMSRQKFEEALKREKLTLADLIAPGLSEGLNVASTSSEIARFKTKLRFRAEVLTVLLEETMADLDKAEAWIPSDAPRSSEGKADPA
jgi:hypothetical protein